MKWTKNKIQLFSVIASESNLSKFLHRMDPSLPQRSDKLEVARRVLSIVYQMTIFPYGDRRTSRVDHNVVSAQEYYQRVIRQYKPVLCGGINTFFCRILQEEFHINAFVINMGIASTPKTHVVTIVPLKDRYYLFDAHYGCYFTCPYGQLLDLESIFAGAPFILRCLNEKKTFVHNTTKDREIVKGNVTMIGKIDASHQVYQYSPQKSPFKNNYFLLSKKHKFLNCSWKETCVLQYLDFGSLFGLACSSKEIGANFLQMLARHKIPCTLPD